MLHSSLEAQSCHVSQRQASAGPVFERSSGFATFWLIAAIAFVATFGTVLWIQWQSSHSLAEHAPSTLQDTQVADAATADATEKTPTREIEQTSTLSPDLATRNDPDKQTALPVVVEEPAFSREPTQEPHEQWLEQLYVQLNSPETPTLTPTADEVDTSRVISGRVLTRSGRPVPGVEVGAQLRQYFKTLGSDSASQKSGALKTTTNDKGFYAFRDLSVGIYMIATRESGSRAPARIEVLSGVKYADLVLELQRSVLVSGVVTDTMRMELEGVRIMPMVKGIPQGAVSNPDGEFEFSVALQGDARSFPVRFQLEGYREQRYQVSDSDWSGEGRLAMTVAMEPVYEFTTVSGSVMDTTGVSVAGETVRLYSPSLKRNYRAVSDAGGGFMLTGIEIADDYQLWVRPTGPYRDFTEQNLQLSQGSLRRDIELEPLQRGYRLSGRILDQEEKPIPNFTLTLRSKDASGQKLQVNSNANGGYLVENVPEGDLIFESRTMPYYTVSGIRLTGDVKEHHMDLVVNRGQHKLLGKVVNGDGRPVATPRVSITSSQVINGIRSQSSSSTGADAKGRFLFTGLGSGQHTVTVNAPGYDGIRLKSVAGMQDELVVRLEKNSF